jgi:hypothetical protein
LQLLAVYASNLNYLRGFLIVKRINPAFYDMFLLIV